MTDILAQIIEQASLSPVFSLLLSIPRVGELTAATILGEIGAISRYSKKLSEGKPSKIAIVATSSKLLRIIYGIWNSQQPFTV